MTNIDLIFHCHEGSKLKIILKNT